ncbi:MAG: thioredoxin [Deltaproteobacteria bacterium]|nr:thioredoxin [Deltaproteobacteria bacterium]
MLNTNLKHVENEATFNELLADNPNVMLVCGREGPMCLPVYDVMENLEGKYAHVAFRDMSFDGPAAHLIKRLPETRGFTGLPFTLYFKNGKVAAATSSIQNKKQITEILEETYGADASQAA